MVRSRRPDDGFLTLSPFPGLASLCLYSRETHCCGGQIAAGRSRLTSYRHSRPARVSASLSQQFSLVSGSHLPETGWVLCPSLPWGCRHLRPQPHGLKSMKGWGPKDNEGAGAGSGAGQRTAEVKGSQSVLLFIIVWIESKLLQPNSSPYPLLGSTKISDRKSPREGISRAGD